MSNALENHGLISAVPALTCKALTNTTAPEDSLQIDSMLELPASSCFENKVTAMDVFSGYLFAYRTSNRGTKTIAKLKLTS